MVILIDLHSANRGANAEMHSQFLPVLGASFPGMSVLMTRYDLPYGHVMIVSAVCLSWPLMVMEQ